MATWDPKRGVLYHEFNKFHKERSLREVGEPNLLRNIFPYREVPKVDFDFAILPINPARNFLITDTTFRDGQQARPPFTVEQISTLFDFFTNYPDREESSANPNFSCTPKRTGKLWRSAGERATSIP